VASPHFLIVVRFTLDVVICAINREVRVKSSRTMPTGAVTMSGKGGTADVQRAGRPAARTTSVACLPHRKPHTSTTSGKGAPGSSQTMMVELDWVAVLPLGRRMTDEERGPDDED